MSRFILRCTFVLAGVFIATVMLVRAQPPAASDARNLLLPPPDCAMPCWQGIRPGQTTIDEALAILEALPGVGGVYLASDIGRVHVNWSWASDFPVADSRGGGWLYADEGIVRALEFEPNLTIGDMWLVFGMPELGTVGYSRSGVFHYAAYPEAQMQMFSLIACPARLRAFWSSTVEVRMTTLEFDMGEYRYLGWLPKRVCR